MSQDICDLAEHVEHVWNEIERVWLPDDIKGRSAQARKAAPVPLKRFNPDLVMRSNFSVALQLFLGKVNDGNVCPQQRKRRRLLPAAARQAKHIFFHVTY